MSSPAPKRPITVPAAGRLAGTAVLLIAFFVYLRTMPSGFPFGDSAELAAVSYTLGIAHPTTYPLFTVVGYVWSHLPFPGTPMYRLDMLAAFQTALATWVFFKISYLIAARLRSSQDQPSELWQVGVGATGGLAFAFASIIWDRGSMGYKEYSLQLVLFGALVFFALRAVLEPESERRSFLLAGLLLGFCLTNHLTVLFAIPGLLVLYFGRKGFNTGSLKLFALMAMLVLLPLPIYLYGPLRSSGSFPFSGMPKPVLNEGLVGYGWPNFMAAVSGRGFRDLMFAQGAFTANVKAFANVLPNQFVFGIALVPALAGFAFLWRRSRLLFWFFAVVIGLTLLWSLNYAINDIEQYFQIPVMGLIILVVVGVVALRPRAAWIVPVFGLFPIVSLIQNFSKEDNSGPDVDRIYVKAILDDLEPNAVLATDDWKKFTSALFYLQNVEGYRKDVSVIIPENFPSFPVYIPEAAIMYPETFSTSDPGAVKLLADFKEKAPLDTLQQDTFAYLRELILKNLKDKPVYFDIQSANLLFGRNVPYNDISFLPDGFAYRLIPAGQQPSVKPPTFKMNGLFDAEFKSGDPFKLEILKSLGNCLLMNGHVWRQNPTEMQTLAKVFVQLNSKVKAEGLEKR